MGSYLSRPVTEKVSSDDGNDKLVYGASSMQGWRVTQEDAHNSILDFDENSAFFAVYDGHGGHEVAQYCSQKLPQFIKDTEAYKKGDIEQALTEGFLMFDASIATPEVVAALKEIASEKEAEESDEEENVNNLYEEASMPIEKVIEKYTSLVNPLKRLQKGDKLPKSPMITAKKDSSIASASSSSSEADGVINEPQKSNSSSNEEKDDNGCSSSSNSSKIEADSSSGMSEAYNGDDESLSNKYAVNEAEEKTPASNGSVPEITISSPPNADNEIIESEEMSSTVTHNGDAAIETPEAKDDVSSSVGGDIVTNKAKGKSPMKKLPKPAVTSTRPKRNATQLYKKLLEFQEESEEDTEDEEDKTFVGPGENSSEDEDPNISGEVEADSEVDTSSASDADVAEGEADEEGEEEEDEDDDNEHDLEFARNMKEDPGSDSGCTAVVAILKGCDLFVANAGDSRCIVCRNGKAVEMSFDHKPEDAPEKTRILKAGGRVTADCRVNGGLNLSRAIGDHAYKQNKELSDREQMITALPDVKKLRLNPSEDEFMVLACDGIWNFMTSQEVVDFVKNRINENPDKLSHICEEMFDHCLAPDTMGDGTGCDNMTCIIVRFKSTLKKRSMSPEPSNSEEGDSKRAKTEECHSVQTL